jgi:hypothetical protein
VNSGSPSSTSTVPNLDEITSPCCRRTVETWYRAFLHLRNGNHSERITEYFQESNRDLAPLFANLLDMGIEFRVAASKAAGLARMQPLICEECKSHIALVILGLPFMLLIFRLQGIFLSMIDEWKIMPDENNKYRERISWHDAGSTQVHQLVLGLDMYLGDRDVTQEGLDELIASINAGDAHARSVLLDALRIAESWTVGHEVSHVCLAVRAGGAFPEFATAIQANEDVIEYAEQFCNQITELFRLTEKVAKSWLEEFQADLLSCRMLFTAIADRRFMASGEVQVPTEDARFHAGRAILNGVAAALEAMYMVDVKRNRVITLDQVRNSSHPPHHVRWRLVKLFMGGLVGVTDDTIFKTTDLMSMLSRSLIEAYEAKPA